MSAPQTLRKDLPGLWRVLRHFWPQVRKHRLLMLGSLATLLMEVGLRLLEPWPLKVVFDRVINKMHGAHGYRVSLFDIFDPVTLLAMMAIAMVAITGLRALAGYGSTIGFAKIGNRVLTRVRAQLYRQGPHSRRDARPDGLDELAARACGAGGFPVVLAAHGHDGTKNQRGRAPS